MAYISPKIEVKKSSITEKGVFAKQKIKKRELVCDFSGSKGQLYSAKDRREYPERWHDYDVQVSENLFWGATNRSELETCDYINHSCEPNCGIRDTLKIVAMRDIQPGEEITFDYAMTESHPMRVVCGCKKPNCRKILTGSDWKKKELQKRYKGFFSDYLQRKINQRHDARAYHG